LFPIGLPLLWVIGHCIRAGPGVARRRRIALVCLIPEIRLAAYLLISLMIGEASR
jgi:hypothetical protein